MQNGVARDGISEQPDFSPVISVKFIWLLEKSHGFFAPWEMGRNEQGFGLLMGNM